MKYMAQDDSEWSVYKDTPKKNVTLWEEGEAYVRLQYYIRYRQNGKDDSECKEKYQFHGNCYHWGISAAEWTAKKGQDAAEAEYGKDSYALC